MPAPATTRNIVDTFRRSRDVLRPSPADDVALEN